MQKNRCAVVLLGGSIPSAPCLQSIRLLAGLPFTVVIAADGGARIAAEAGICPQLIVGDGDSLPQGMFPNVQRIRYPANKDFTDGYAALYEAARLSYGPILVCGATGGRMDHQLMNLMMPLSLAEQDLSRVRLWDGQFYCRYSCGEVDIQGAAGDLLSIIPLYNASGVTISGVKYPLFNAYVSIGDTLTVSNVMSERVASIRHRDGILLVMHGPQQDSESIRAQYQLDSDTAVNRSVTDNKGECMMKEIGNLDENKVWECCFPHFYKWSLRHGTYVVPGMERILKSRESAGDLDKLQELLLRVEIAINVLWEQLSDLFAVDFFPHLLCAATDMLRAADFGENSDDETLKAQVRELAEAVDELEKYLTAQDEAGNHID